VLTAVLEIDHPVFGLDAESLSATIVRLALMSIIGLAMTAPPGLTLGLGDEFDEHVLAARQGMTKNHAFISTPVWT